MKRVLIIQRRLTAYRIRFFEALRKELADRHIELVLAHGTPTDREDSKKDGGSLPWAHNLNTSYLLGGRICWQPFNELARASDLTILTHENKLICNLWAQYILTKSRVALWGHGANLQGNSASLRERIKRSTASQSDWWFGYTETSRQLILQSGFPADRVSIVENSIDTIELRNYFESAKQLRSESLRHELGIKSQCVGVFIGSLYGEKRIDFLLEAAQRVRAEIPDFELVVAGAGPDCGKVKALGASSPWLHYLGPVNTDQKAKILASSRVMLNPGLVGLGILDSFVCHVPMVTTDCGLHSPEISYLKNGFNGIMTPNNLTDFVNSVIEVIRNKSLHTQLTNGCKESSDRYTIDNMTRRFSDGVVKCLASPIWRGIS